MDKNANFIELLNVNDYLKKQIESTLGGILYPSDRIEENWVSLPIQGLEGISLTFIYDKFDKDTHYLTKLDQQMSGLTNQQLYDLFLKNAQQPDIEPFGDLIKNPKMSKRILAVSNYDLNLGSSVLLTSIDEIKERFHQNLYIFFLSVHIALFVCDDGSGQAEKLANYIHGHCQSKIEGDDDYLSNHLYYYDIENNGFKTLI